MARGFLLSLLSFIVAACSYAKPGVSDVLLFAGQGTSANDVAAIESLLRQSRVDYATATSRQMNALSVPELHAYRLLIVPGGNFEEIGNGLTAETTARVRAAVGEGLNYLGICAGAFFAGASPYNGLNLTSGVRFPFYRLENQGIRKARVLIKTSDGSPLEIYWEDGPQLTGWGKVIARYPDGTPAVAQGAFVKGWVVLAGVHAEAQEAWRAGMGFTTGAERSHAYAVSLIEAALHHSSEESRSEVQISPFLSKRTASSRPAN